jgi:tRNA 2-thiouridine synthesizing protein A
MTDATLDARRIGIGQLSPRARKALKDLKLGQTLEVLATDPLAIPDFEAFCLTTGNELVEAATQDGEHRIVIRVGAC